MAAARRRCANCGGSLRARDRFCGSCGTRIDAVAASPAFVPSPAPSRLDTAVSRPAGATESASLQIAGVAAAALGEQRKVVTILFADLRGSTALAERLRPEEAVAILNTYLRVMARCVIDAGGILDKFLGDGLMAIFGAMGDQTHGAAAATRAALDMRARLGQLNAAREARGDPVVRFGVGMHTGDVVLGAIGLPERSDFTAIGDTVNTASRMESLTKEFGVDAVLSGVTAGHLTDAVGGLRPLGEAQVRGRTAPVDVFTLR